MHYSTATEHYPDLSKRFKQRAPKEESQTQQFNAVGSGPTFVHHPILFNINIQDYKVDTETLKQIIAVLRVKNVFKIGTKDPKQKVNNSSVYVQPPQQCIYIKVYISEKEVPKVVDSHLDIGVSYMAL
jgi:hypothetical protein